MRINIKRLVTYINIGRAKQTASSQRKCPHKQELGFLLQLLMEVAFSRLCASVGILYLDRPTSRSCEVMNLTAPVLLWGTGHLGQGARGHKTFGCCLKYPKSLNQAGVVKIQVLTCGDLCFYLWS